MATKITVALEDDLDGGPADETVRFGLDGPGYEIDLNKKNAAALRKKLAPFVEHARKAGRGQRRREARGAASRERGSDIRAWAKDQGIAVSRRGRIRPAWWSSTRPPPGDGDHRADHGRLRISPRPDSLDPQPCIHNFATGSPPVSAGDAAHR